MLRQDVERQSGCILINMTCIVLPVVVSVTWVLLLFSTHTILLVETDC